jgi:hypothetical protein
MKVVEFTSWEKGWRKPFLGRRIILDKRKLYRTAFLFIFLVALVGFACQIPGIPGEGVPTQEPGEPTAPPEVEPTAPPEVEPTAPPEVEPTAPPEVEPTAPGGEVGPPDEGEGDSSDTLINGLFYLVIIVVVILGIALIVSLFTGRRKDPAPVTTAPEPEPTPSYAETTDVEEGAQPIPEAAVVSVLDNMTPQVAPLYDRFVSLVQALGPVTILPTQTRVDFQRRIIFASTQFSQEDLRVQLLLPQRVDDPRMVRIEVFSEDKVSHTLVMRTLDDFDQHFTTWLQDSYELGS